jgi:hypothetical protein
MKRSWMRDGQIRSTCLDGRLFDEGPHRAKRVRREEDWKMANVFINELQMSQMPVKGPQAQRRRK